MSLRLALILVCATLPLVFASCASMPAPQSGTCPCAAGWHCCAGQCLVDSVACDPDAGPGGPGRWEEAHLEIVPPTCNLSGTWLADDRCTGWIKAVRLTPERYPFVAERVVYGIPEGAHGDVVCNPGIAHEVVIFRGDDVTPPENPVFDRRIQVGASDAGEAWINDIAFDEPLTIEHGHVFVGIPLAGKVPNVYCWAGCNSPEKQRTYISYSAAPPYPWVDDQPKLGKNLALRVEGRQWVQ